MNDIGAKGYNNKETKDYVFSSQLPRKRVLRGRKYLSTYTWELATAHGHDIFHKGSIRTDAIKKKRPRIAAQR